VAVVLSFIMGTLALS